MPSMPFSAGPRETIIEQYSLVLKSNMETAAPAAGRRNLKNLPDKLISSSSLFRARIHLGVLFASRAPRPL